MTNNLYLLYNFNNYFNRKLIKHDTLQQYLTAVNNDYDVIQNCVNFNPNDGVSTEQIINVGAYNTINLRQPNYMLVVDESNDIQQRWFVVDAPRTRAGQMKLELQRDVVADSWDVVKTAPTFVEKAIVAENDPAIWNNENVELNQIKQSQTLLKDRTNCPWIVGYMTKNNLVEGEIVGLDNSFVAAQITDYTELTDYPYYNYLHDFISGNNDVAVSGISGVEHNVNVLNDNTHTVDLLRFTATTSRFIYDGGEDAMTGLRTDAGVVPAQNFMYKLQDRAETLRSALEDTKTIDQDLIQTLKGEDYKIIHTTSDDKYYRINYDIRLRHKTEMIPAGTQVGNVYQAQIDSANAEAPYLYENFSTLNNYTWQVKYDEVVYELDKKDITNTIWKIKISNRRKRLKDAPYSMFAIPAGDVIINTSQTQGYVIHGASFGFNVANAIANKFGGGATPELYDLQLLPYFPRPDIIKRSASGNYTIPLNELSAGVDYDWIDNASNTGAFIMWFENSSFTFNIPHAVDVSGRKKLENECSFYRLCSPNWNGQFEFNAAKNNGITNINVDCTYKPYQPYIHLNPDFKGLYGDDYNDARGLVCGGKFDLPQTAEAWSNYERQNTNYNAIFNRQIENLEIQQKYQRMADIVGAIGGTATNAANGAAMGAAVGTSGGPAGMIAGGIIGGVAGAGAGVADIYVSDKLRAEQMDYTKDMYALNLQNIKAQPNSLVGVGSLTYNNTIFPTIEYYTCTDKERTAVADKIKYNGMTVNRIGTISEFKNNLWLGNEYNYFKGKLIRIDVPDEDWHFVNVLKSELDRGIFIKRGEP